ncbi:MmgE/PrpD family protein [Bordetella genomosp. 5]|uniref:MmgE/PrpD family protein n=1 Tax=Bordetella genomosp. 5 TaxID=1395608 RepID=UPI000B9EBC31|nr:MmgE/PrpD family protein [Bordetella genomosp. 5]OZI47393.1 MmgE/PrpD family protein [Bordetella genomosp. 5]
MSLVGELARICLRPASPADRERAALHVAAWTGAAALGATTPLAAALRRGYAPPGRIAPRAGDGWSGLLLEASLGCMHELDDFHREALVHPGPVVIPAALHVARRTATSGAATLLAILRGYEAMIRMGESVGTRHYEQWHNTSSCGAAGAAVAASSLLGLDAARTADALALAVTQSSGLWQIRLDPSDAKPWSMARASQTGVQAALLAQAGIRGPAHALEGEKGFYAATCPDPLPARIGADPAGPWKIHQTTFKPWAACRHAHPAIDAALALRDAWQERDGWRALPDADIAAIRVDTYGDAIAFCDRARPATPHEARFSVQHAVAVALNKGSPEAGDFAEGAIADAAHARMRALVRTVPCAEYSARYPRHFGATVTVILTDGRELRHEVHDALGDPERPMTTGQVLDLARLLMESAGWTPQRARRRMDAILSLGRLPRLGSDDFSPMPSARRRVQTP